MFEYIKIDNHSSVPKYKQIMRSIQNAMSGSDLVQGQQIPSINEVRDALGVSRETVIKAYNELKTRGIIASSPGKGYYISSTDVHNKRNIFLLFDDFTTYREILYNSFRNALGPQTNIVLFFHHFNPKVYQPLIREALGKYTHYVVVPLTDQALSDWLRETMVDKRVYILDLGCEMFGRRYPSVCQNFSKSIYEALADAHALLRKYGKIIVVWGEPESQFTDLIKKQFIQGLEKYCTEFAMPLKIIDSMKGAEIEAKECYLVPSDFDLVSLIDQIRAQSLELGKDIGIISHNDTPLKKVVADGITTFSTDFEHMGRAMAEMIVDNRSEHIENPSRLIIRGSL